MSHFGKKARQNRHQHVIVVSHTFRLLHALATVRNLVENLPPGINQVRLEIRNHFSSHYLAFNETVSLKLISGERQIKIIPIFNSDLEQF